MQIPPELLVMLTAMVPVLELRAAIPLGFLLKLPVEATFFWAQIGNILPVFFILKLLGPVSDFLMRHSQFFKKFFTKLFNYTHKKNAERFEKFGSIILVSFTALPLPGSGAWTGSLIAFLFNMRYSRAVLLIFIGNIIDGIFMLIGTTSIVEAIKFFRFT